MTRPSLDCRRRADRTDGRAGAVPPRHPRTHHRQAGRPPDDVPCRRRTGARWSCSSCAAWRTRWSGLATPALPPASMAEASASFGSTSRGSTAAITTSCSFRRPRPSYPAHGGREAGGPDRARRRARWAGAGRALPDPNPVRVVLRHADGRLEQAAPWLISAEGRTASCGPPSTFHSRGRPRRAVRPGRPAHRWRTRGDRSAHLLLRTAFWACSPWATGASA